MSLLLKDPSAVLDYAIDWESQYLEGDYLVESSWSVEPDDVQVVGASFDHGSSCVKVAGGLPGRIYRLSNHVVTAAGREDQRSIVLRVEAR